MVARVEGEGDGFWLWRFRARRVMIGCSWDGKLLGCFENVEACRMKILYLDESGNHDMGKIDPDYPVFVLGGVIVDGKYAVTVLEAELSSFKLRWFGSTKTVLHTADITRNRGEFEMLIDAETRERFYDDLNAMMRRLDYSVVACVVDKYGCAKQRKWNGVDAYTLALEMLIESFLCGDWRCMRWRRDRGGEAASRAGSWADVNLESIS